MIQFNDPKTELNTERIKMKRKVSIKVYALLAFIMFLSNVVFAENRHTLNALFSNGEQGRFLLKEESISFDKIPTSIDEFISLRNQIAGKPKGASAIFIIAMMTYGRNNDLGKKFLTIALDRRLLIQNNSQPNYKGYVPNDKVMYFVKMMNNFSYKGNLYLGNIYIEGTDYNKGYTLPKNGPYTINFNQLTIKDENNIILYINTTSGNAPRPLVLRKNNRGIWKAIQVSSIFVGPMRSAKKESIDDDL